MSSARLSFVTLTFSPSIQAVSQAGCSDVQRPDGGSAILAQQPKASLTSPLHTGLQGMNTLGIRAATLLTRRDLPGGPLCEDAIDGLAPRGKQHTATSAPWCVPCLICQTVSCSRVTLLRAGASLPVGLGPQTVLGLHTSFAGTSRSKQHRDAGRVVRQHVAAQLLVSTSRCLKSELQTARCSLFVTGEAAAVLYLGGLPGIGQVGIAIEWLLPMSTDAAI